MSAQPVRPSAVSLCRVGGGNCSEYLGPNGVPLMISIDERLQPLIGLWQFH